MTHTAQIIDGKSIAQAYRQQLVEEVKSFAHKHNCVPYLAVILVGDHAASEIYVKNKANACQEVGMRSELYRLPSNVTESALIQLIEQLNQDDTVHGILLQLPLPDHIDSMNLLERISPDKDVDGFHPYNVGRLAQRRPHIRPCTPYGVMHLLDTIQCDYKNTHAVVVGSSNIVGRPMALELLLAGATVTICHRFTNDLASQVSQADLLITAVGKPGLIQAAWLKPGVIICDVAMCRLPDGSLTGDVDFEAAKQVASYITPVPGGVGPMTVAMLLRNTLECARNQFEINLL